MKRWCLIALAACGGKADPGSGSATGSTTGTNTTAPAIDESDPTMQVVTRAFAGKRPALPLLSKDGNAAAVEIATPIVMSGGKTYSIGFVTAGADAWSGGTQPEMITLVDAKLVHLLEAGMETSAAPVIDIDSIKQLATGVSERLAADAYAPFEKQLDAIGVRDAISLGPFTLQVTEETTGAITIAVSAQERTTTQIQPMPMGQVGTVECVAMPRVKRAWLDGGRGRLLLQVGWNTGPEQCDTPDEQFRLFRR